MNVQNHKERSNNNNIEPEIDFSIATENGLGNLFKFNAFFLFQPSSMEFMQQAKNIPFF